MTMFLTSFILVFVSLIVASMFREREEIFDGLLVALGFGSIGFVVILIIYLIMGVS